MGGSDVGMPFQALGYHFHASGLSFTAALYVRVSTMASHVLVLKIKCSDA